MLNHRGAVTSQPLHDDTTNNPQLATAVYLLRFNLVVGPFT